MDWRPKASGKGWVEGSEKSDFLSFDITLPTQRGCAAIRGPARIASVSSGENEAA